LKKVKHALSGGKRNIEAGQPTHLTVAPQIDKCDQVGERYDVVGHIVDFGGLERSMTREPMGAWVDGGLRVLLLLLFLLLPGYFGVRVRPRMGGAEYGRAISDVGLPLVPLSTASMSSQDEGKLGCVRTQFLDEGHER
jgi:hypothetical protein